MRGIKPVEQRAGEGQERKAAHAARPDLPALGVELLEGQPEKEPEAEQQQKARNWRVCRHGDYLPPPLCHCTFNQPIRVAGHHAFERERRVAVMAATAIPGSGNGCSAGSLSLFWIALRCRC